MEVNEKFVNSDDHTLLPINVGVSSLTICDDGKELILINIVFFLSTA